MQNNPHDLFGDTSTIGDDEDLRIMPRVKRTMDHSENTDICFLIVFSLNGHHRSASIIMSAETQSIYRHWWMNANLVTACMILSSIGAAIAVSRWRKVERAMREREMDSSSKTWQSQIVFGWNKIINTHLQFVIASFASQYDGEINLSLWWWSGGRGTRWWFLVTTLTRWRNHSDTLIWFLLKQLIYRYWEKYK